jgi:hypothetical protein
MSNDTVREALAERDEQYRPQLASIGAAIGYGNAQHILGQLWDAMLVQDYGPGFGGRGRMGVTIDDALPPIPKAERMRRERTNNGSYQMVPAYSVAELKAFAHAAIDRALAAAPAQPTCDGCGKPVRPLLCGHCAPASEPQAEPQPEAIPIAPVEVVRQALKELLESISECRMDQVTARFAKASVMARAVVDRYKDAT